MKTTRASFPASPDPDDIRRAILLGRLVTEWNRLYLDLLVNHPDVPAWIERGDQILARAIERLLVSDEWIPEVSPTPTPEQLDAVIASAARDVATEYGREHRDAHVLTFGGYSTPGGQQTIDFADEIRERRLRLQEPTDGPTPEDRRRVFGLLRALGRWLDHLFPFLQRHASWARSNARAALKLRARRRTFYLVAVMGRRIPNVRNCARRCRDELVRRFPEGPWKSSAIRTIEGWVIKYIRVLRGPEDLPAGT